MLIMKISKTRGARPVKRNERMLALQSTEAKLRYEFNSVSNSEFFRQLNFHSKKKLIFQLFGSFVHTFSYFFEDVDFNY